MLQSCVSQFQQQQSLNEIKILQFLWWTERKNTLHLRIEQINGEWKMWKIIIEQMDSFCPDQAKANISCVFLRRNSFGKFVSTKRVHLSLSCFICTQKHDWQMSRCLLRWSNELSEGVLFFRSFVYTQKWHEWQISLSVAMTKVELLWSPGKTKCTKVLWS